MKYGIIWTHKLLGTTEWADVSYFNGCYCKSPAVDDGIGKAIIENINDAYRAKETLEEQFAGHFWEVRER